MIISFEEKNARKELRCENASENGEFSNINVKYCSSQYGKS